MSFGPTSSGGNIFFRLGIVDVLSLNPHGLQHFNSKFLPMLWEQLVAVPMAPDEVARLSAHDESAYGSVGDGPHPPSVLNLGS